MWISVWVIWMLVEQLLAQATQSLRTIRFIHGELRSSFPTLLIQMEWSSPKLVTVTRSVLVRVPAIDHPEPAFVSLAILVLLANVLIAPFLLVARLARDMEYASRHEQSPMMITITRTFFGIKMLLKDASAMEDILDLTAP